MSPILGIWASAQSGSLLANSYESIATVTVGAGGSSSITFSSIPSTYKHLQIRILTRMTRAVSYASQCPITFNSDTTNYYRGHYLNGDGSTASAGAFTGGTPLGCWSVWAVGNSATANAFSANIVDILDYQNSNKYKTVRTLYGTDINGVNGDVGLYSSLFMSTAAITDLTITCSNSSNFMQYSSFALYGIKGA